MNAVQIALGLTLVNATTMLCFAKDKRAAIERRRRLPEKDLLALAVLGGTPAAFLARRIFRHKTRKEPFSTHLALIAMMQAGALIGWFAI